MDGTSQKRTVDCILELAEVYLQVFDKSQDAAAQLVAKCVHYIAIAEHELYGHMGLGMEMPYVFMWYVCV